MPDVKHPGRLGKYIETVLGGERVRAFVPPPLPPIPPINFTPLLELVEEANQALGRLDGVASILPDTPLFLYMYVRKEALLSSQIEGTQSSLSELLLFEMEDAPGVPLDDAREVSNYVAAMDYGLGRLRNGFPLSLRLIKEIHEILLSTGRGEDKTLGEFRRSQNWIGGTRPGNALFVPPPADLVIPCMGDLEKFIHDDSSKIPTLVKAALVHVQFETIHPFLDGNGRLGRLLITFLLCERKILNDPLLYLSLFFKARRTAYYDLLQSVRENGDWEAWLEFFLAGVRETSNQAVDTARRILSLFDADLILIQSLGRPASSAMRVHQLLQTKPVTTIPSAAKRLGLTYPTVTKALAHLVRLNIAKEITGRQWGQTFVYNEYLSILAEGTEPLPR